MKFDTPAGSNPIDRLRVVGQPLDRIDGPAKVCGVAPYAYEWRDVSAAPAYGAIVGAGIAKGRIAALHLDAARAAPGVLAVLGHQDVGPLNQGKHNTVKLLAGPDVDHYHQAIAIVVAQTFEQARAAAALVRADYETATGRYDLEAGLEQAESPDGGDSDSAVGDFEQAYAQAPVQLDATYRTPGQSHAMMEPHASLAAWEGDQLTIWTANQMIDWTTGDVARTLGIPKKNVRLVSPYIGGGFGGKLFLRADALLAALAARATGRPVKVALTRALMFNNTTHRAATIQRLRIGTDRDGRIQAIAHENWSGDQPGGAAEQAAAQTKLMYAGAHRLTRHRVATLDLPEANAMRAPGDAPGHMALEVAMDEMAEKLGMDPIAFRILNDTQVDPENPERRFTQRQMVRCLDLGAETFGWPRRRAQPAQVRDGDLLIGLGVAAALRNNLVAPSGARVRLEADGKLVVETDMTDIGTGSYTVIAQTAAEMLGLPIDHVTVRLGESGFPVSAGSGGQWGANCSTSGVYAACEKLRHTLAARLGMDAATARFESGRIHDGQRSASLVDAAQGAAVVVEDSIKFGDLDKRFQQSTFGAHFVEVGVDIATGQTHVRRMLAVCAAGRILNPKTARSQVIGAMTMGVGAALMEQLAVDTRRGYFVNHDLAGYEVPVHADIPRQDVIFLDETDPYSSPMKAKGVGELGICGAAAAVANAVYNATGVRVRDYPLTLDKLLAGLPALA